MHRRRPLEPVIGEMLLDIAFQRRPPESIIEAIVERRT
jgi:hypothetical protein